MQLPPIRLCGQAFLFAWRMCLFFSPIMLVFSEDPSTFLVAGRLSFLLSCAVSLTVLVYFEQARPSVLTSRSMVLLGIVCAAGGSALAVFGSSSGVSQMGVAVCGYALAGVGDSFFALSFGRLYSALGVKLSMRVVPFATAFAAILYAVLANGTPVVSVPAIVAMPMVCGFVVLYDSAREQRLRNAAETDGSHGEAFESVAQNASEATFTKWKISTYTAVLWFSFGIMWSLAIGRVFYGGGLFPAFSLSVATLVVIAALVVAALSYLLKLPTAKTFWVFVPLVVAGISAVAVVDANVQVFAFALVFAARSIAEMQLITHFAAICRRRDFPSTLLYGRGFAILSLGEVAGLLMGAAIVPFETPGLTMVLLVCANVIVVAVILSILRVNATFQKAELEAALAKRDAVVREEKPSSPGEPSVQDVVRLWSCERGLSAREEEVAALLLSGRNVPAISELLCISQSTVHTHVRHIYEKTGVHNRQELIDLRDELLAR